MKQIAKQSLKELIQFALSMPAGELTRYGTMFLSGPVPTDMTRGELIALQLVESAGRGDLDAIRELRHWVAEDPKSPNAGGTINYTQYLIQVAAGGLPAVAPGEAAAGLQQMARRIEEQVRNPTPVYEDL